MRYHNSLVPVGETSPPEELPSRIAGGCSRWQICIGVMAFISELIHGLNLYSKMITEPRKLNFTCENGNGSKCFDINGNKCQKFIFFKEYNLTTFTEKFSLVCDEEAKRIWIENSFRIGVIISYFIIGWTADRCGRKIAAMTFIPLHCLSGALTLIYSNYGMLLFFHLIHGVFCTSVNLLPKVALCDSVGNKWRTFALGFTVYPLPISWMLVVYFTTLFSDIKEIIGAIAVLPLILLVPLLYFRDSPIYILLKSDFVEAEEVLRKIAQFNNCPLSRDIRIRPVELIEKTLPDQGYAFWQSPKTKRPFLALLCIWFFQGITMNILLNLADENAKNINNIIIFGLCSLFGSFVGIFLCHLIHHRVVICIFSFLNIFFILAVILLPVYLKKTAVFATFMLNAASFFIHRVTNSALDNLTPRMFPTGFRSRGLGMCCSTYHTGILITDLLFYFIYKNKSLWIISPVLVMTALLMEIFSCVWLWKVHKRELPDFMQDCINFQKFYKPPRFLKIQENPVSSVSSQAEVEVKLIDFTDGVPVGDGVSKKSWFHF